MISQSQYAAAILNAGVAHREQRPDHHDIPAKGQEIRNRVLQAIGDLGITATNKPTGGAMASLDMGKIGPKSGKIADAAIKLHSAGGGQIAIVFVGESHESPGDAERAKGLIDKVGANASFNDTVFVIEREMKYQLPPNPARIREENLTSANGWQFGVDKLEPDNRTIVVAGYLLAYAASDDQNRNILFIVLFGDRHADLADQFEYLVKSAGRYGVGWVEKRPRSYCRAAPTGG